MNPDPGNHADFRPDAYTIGPPYYRTPAGEFENSRSMYGTFDQGGNAWEWNDTVITSEYRGYRGGSWGDSSSILAASYRGYGIPSGGGTSYLGFRVASVPETDSRPRTNRSTHRPEAAEGNDVLLPWQQVRAGVTPS